MNYEQMLFKSLENNKDIIILTAENRGPMRGLPEKCRDKFIDVGIAEQTMIGMSAGFALRGRIPVVHALATFLTMRAFEFIRTDIGISNLPVKLVGTLSGFLSESNGPTHQALEDISLMRTIPGMNIFCPADLNDMVLGLPSVFQSDNPFYIRYNDKSSLVSHSPFEIGKAEVFGEGKDVCIICYGFLFTQTYLAKEILERNGISVKLINVRTLKPLDEAKILKCISECKMVFTIEDHFLSGGLFTIVSELLILNGLFRKIIPFALDSRWFKPLPLDEVLEHENFSAEHIARKIEESIRDIERH